MTARRFSPKKFKSIRLHMGFSPEDVDRTLVMPPGACASWEEGEGKPSIDQFFAAVAMLQCEHEDLTAETVVAAARSQR